MSTADSLSVSWILHEQYSTSHVYERSAPSSGELGLLQTIQTVDHRLKQSCKGHHAKAE